MTEQLPPDLDTTPDPLDVPQSEDDTKVPAPGEAPADPGPGNDAPTGAEEDGT